MENKRFFFVIGMPRTRTAWLSVLLTHGDTFCFHEGTGKRATFAEYVAMLRARPEACVGDSNAGLPEHIDALLAEFPDAHFVVMRRDEKESLRSLCAADPARAQSVRDSWPAYVASFEEATKKLPRCLFFDSKELKSESACGQITQHLAGFKLDSERFRKLADLHITSTFPPIASKPFVLPEINIDGFDFSGLTVRAYSPTDREMVADWWKTHRAEDFGTRPLPPLGIIVEREGVPLGALWCYETFGVGVAWIEMPVSKPGLSLRDASNVMAFAVFAITKLAGAGHEPRGEFTRFRVTTPPAIARVLKRLGFVELPQQSNLLLSTHGN